MRRPFSKPKPLPEGISKPVAALVDKLFDRWRTVDDWVHAALTLPDLVETQEDRELAVRSLCDRLDRRPGYRPVRKATNRVRTTLANLTWMLISLLLLVGLTLVTEQGVTSALIWAAEYIIILSLFRMASSIFGGDRSGSFRFNVDEVRAACARSLGVLGDVSTIPTLANHTRDYDEGVAFESRKSLFRLLPSVQDDAAFRFSGATSTDLGRLLRLPATNAEAETILRTVQHAGTLEAVPYVAAFMGEAPTAHLGTISREVLETLKQRAEDDRKRDTLLRPAEAAAETLLRPAASYSGDPDYLLHAVQPDDGG